VTILDYAFTAVLAIATISLLIRIAILVAVIRNRRVRR